MVHRLNWCLMKYRIPLGRNDGGSRTASGVASRRLCIVSPDRPLSAASIATLKTRLGPGEELEIIVDRRGDETATHQPSIERRYHPDVDLALERDGFAIVPTETPRPAAYGRLKVRRVPLTSPIARLALKDAAARELERTLGFKRRRTAGLGRWLIVAGLVNAVLVLLFLLPPLQTFPGRARPAAPRIAETPRPASAPQVTATPSPRPEVREIGRAHV